MKKISTGKLSIALAASLMLGVTNLTVTSYIARASTSSNQDDNQKVVAPANCRRVKTSGNPLNVRSSPNGTIIGTLADGTIVNIEGSASNGWVMISSPQKGMVFEQYLTSCDANTTTTTTKTTANQTQQTSTEKANCRRVISKNGLNVRSSPNGDIIGTLAGGAEVTVEKVVNNNWVMISAPQKGMVFARYLGSCLQTSTSETTATQTTATQTQPETAAQGMCRRVKTAGAPLNVRSTPNGTIIGTLANGTEVTVEKNVNNAWVMISSPQKGMVFTAYLVPCSEETATGTTATATSAENCRRILSSEAVSVKKEPSDTSESVGTLVNQQRVKIVNRGANGWVPISEPVNGYIPASKLILCPR